MYLFSFEILFTALQVYGSEEKTYEGLRNLYQINLKGLNCVDEYEVENKLSQEIKKFVKACECTENNSQALNHELKTMRNSITTIMSCINTYFQIHLYKLRDQIHFMINARRLPAPSLNYHTLSVIELILRGFVINLRFKSEFLNDNSDSNSKDETRCLNEVDSTLSEFIILLSQYEKKFSEKNKKHCIYFSKKGHVSFKSVLRHFGLFLSVLSNIEGQEKNIDQQLYMELRSLILGSLLPPNEFFEGSLDVPSEYFKYTCILLDDIIFHQYILDFLNDSNKSDSDSQDRCVSKDKIRVNPNMSQKPRRKPTMKKRTDSSDLSFVPDTVEQSASYREPDAMYTQTSLSDKGDPTNFAGARFNIEKPTDSTRGEKSSSDYDKGNETNCPFQTLYSLCNNSRPTMNGFFYKNISDEKRSYLPGQEDIETERAMHTIYDVTCTMVSNMFIRLIEDLCDIENDLDKVNSLKYEQLIYLDKTIKTAQERLKTSDLCRSLTQISSTYTTPQHMILPLPTLIMEMILVAKDLIRICEKTFHLETTKTLAYKYCPLINMFDSWIFMMRSVHIFILTKNARALVNDISGSFSLVRFLANSLGRIKGESGQQPTTSSSKHDPIIDSSSDVQLTSQSMPDGNDVQTFESHASGQPVVLTSIFNSRPVQNRASSSTSVFKDAPELGTKNVPSTNSNPSSKPVKKEPRVFKSFSYPLKNRKPGKFSTPLCRLKIFVSSFHSSDCYTIQKENKPDSVPDHTRPQSIRRSVKFESVTKSNGKRRRPSRSL